MRYILTIIFPEAKVASRYAELTLSTSPLRKAVALSDCKTTTEIHYTSETEARAALAIALRVRKPGEQVELRAIEVIGHGG